MDDLDLAATAVMWNVMPEDEKLAAFDEIIDDSWPISTMRRPRSSQTQESARWFGLGPAENNGGEHAWMP